MNPEQALTEIGKLIDDLRPATPGLYHVRIDKEQIHIVKDPARTALDGELAILTSLDINEGCSTLMWTRIRDRYALFNKRGLI